MVFLPKSIAADVMRFHMMYPAQTDFAVVAVVILAPISACADCVPMMRFAVYTANAALSIFQAQPQVFVDVVLQPQCALPKLHTMFQAKLQYKRDEVTGNGYGHAVRVFVR